MVTRKVFLRSLYGAAVVGLAGCTLDDEDETTDLEELLGEIEYDQRNRIREHHQSLGEYPFDEESHRLETNPEKLAETSGPIDFRTTLGTHPDGELRDMRSASSYDGQEVVTDMLGSLVIQNVWVPVRNANGGGTGYKSAAEILEKRTDSVSARIEDRLENHAELTASRSTVEEFWRRIEQEYREDRSDYMGELSAELQAWASENVEFSHEES